MKSPKDEKSGVKKSLETTLLAAAGGFFFGASMGGLSIITNSDFGDNNILNYI